MIKSMLATTLFFASCICAGVNQIEFFHYRHAYKNRLGLTRHKEFSIPTWTDAQSQSWIGNIFYNESPRSHSGAMTAFKNGVEWVGLPLKSGDVRSIWFNKSNGSYGNQNTIENTKSIHPYLYDVRGSFASEFGDLYAIQPSGWTLVSAKINQGDYIVDSWHASQDNRKYLGVSGKCDEVSCKPIALGSNGYLYEFSADLSSADPLPVFDSTIFTPLIFKGDGKIGADGGAYYWAYGMGSDGKPKISEISILRNGSLNDAKAFSLRVQNTSKIADGAYSPHEWWDDFVPMWISDDEVRIVSISNDYINTYTRDGLLIENSIGTDRTTDQSIKPWVERDGLLYRARLVLSGNNRSSWKARQDFLVVDDFRKEGHGILRFNLTPDGYSDYMPLEVKMKDNSTPNEPIARPTLGISNYSQSRQLVDFKIRIWSSRREVYPDTLLADKYWSEDDSVDVSTGCSPDNPNLCWIDAEFSPSFVLDPNTSTKNDAIQLGFHYSGWRRWNKTSDLSIAEMGPEYAINSNVSIYKKGVGPNTWTLIWGNEFKPTDMPYPLGWVPGPPPEDKSETYVLNISNDQCWGSSNSSSVSMVKSNWGNALAISSGGYIQLQSAPFLNRSNMLGFGIAYSQVGMPDPYWNGYIQIYIECKSLGIHNQWIGQREISPLSFNGKQIAYFEIPNWIRDKTFNIAKDWTLKISFIRPRDANTMTFYGVSVLR